MSIMEQWAKREIEIACKHERGDKDPELWDYGVACYESAFKAFKSLMEDEHSGRSIGNYNEYSQSTYQMQAANANRGCT